MSSPKILIVSGKDRSPPPLRQFLAIGGISFIQEAMRIRSPADTKNAHTGVCASHEQGIVAVYFFSVAQNFARRLTPLAMISSLVA